MIYELQKIKNLFREFYGLLPVLELTQNEKLIIQIEEIEKQLRRLTDDDPTA